MNTKVCPHCGQEKQTRGFHFHEAVCKKKKNLELLKKRYAKQIANMSPKAAERFLRKAQGG